MLAVIFGLSGAAAFGTADFFGGFAAKRIGSLRASWIGASAGLVVIATVFLIFGGTWSAEALFWGALSGASGMFAIIFLYASLAIGPMSVLSPIGALVAAIVPVVFDFFAGQQLSPLGYGAIALALVAVWLVGFVPDPNAIRPRPRGLIFAVAAGTFIGVFMILIDHAPDEAGVLPLIANRVVQVVGTSLAIVAISLVHLARKRGRFGADGPARADVATGERGAIEWRRGAPFAVGSGLIDAIGNSLILYGLISGNLSVVSVLAGLYPGATILLAALFLRERIARIQYLGLALAIVAAAMLAIA
jgi:drug/metabolite transporter (DMT)-like permease